MSMDDSRTMIMTPGGESSPPGAEHCSLCGRTMIPKRRDGNLYCGCCGALIRHAEMKPGEILLDRYRILKLLGVGGFGSVYLVHPVEDVSMRYVVKSLRKSATAMDLRRFIREAEILRNIQYDVIVRLVDFAETDEGHYIVLEYVNGSTLSVLRRKIPFDEESVLIIAKEIAKALDYMWTTHHLIHRDIKPQNIMIDSQNHVKLLDFGMSKCTEDAGTALTMESSGLGTPGYMSPEQFRDSLHAGIQSDMFSLGATMYFLLAGAAPFQGDSIRELYENTLNHTPPDIRRCYPAVSSDTEALMCQMMAPKPADRPGSWQTVISAIRQILQ